MSFASLLDLRVDILRPVLADDGQGGQTVTFATLYRRVPFAFENNSASELALVWDKPTPFPGYSGYLEFRSGVRLGDIVLKSSGERFSIKYLNNVREEGRMLAVTMTQLKAGES